MKKLYQLLFASLIFLLPTNLFLVLTEAQSRIHGLRIDYLLTKLYASDIVIVLIIVLAGFEYLLKKRKQNQSLPSEYVLFISLFGLLLVASFLSSTPVVSVWNTLKLGEFSILAWIWHKRFVRIVPIFPLTISCTLLVQIIFGFWQYITQTSLTPYYLFGETNLASFSGLATSSVGGIERVLPYGTTAHPNILAGVLAIYIMALTPYLRQKSSTLHPVITMCITGLSAIVLLLTQSVSAFGSLLWGSTRIRNRLLMTVLFFSISLGIIIGVVVSQKNSFERRLYLNRAALAMFLEQPITGVGLGSFTAHVERFSDTQEVVRFVQPAHTSFLLWLAETGIVGILFITGVVYILHQKNYLKSVLWAVSVLLPIALLDHYLTSLQTGQLLVVFTAVVFSKSRATQ